MLITTDNYLYKYQLSFFSEVTKTSPRLTKGLLSTSVMQHLTTEDKVNLLVYFGHYGLDYLLNLQLLPLADGSFGTFTDKVKCCLNLGDERKIEKK